MATATLSIRIRKDLKEKMKVTKIDWRREIEEFIEKKLKEVELSKTLETIDKVLSDVPTANEPAWKTVRELRNKT
ncbi:MAG: hypothetical protein ACP5KW_10475 [Thermoproteota archaeon]|jgi:hypothetical protein